MQGKFVYIDESGHTGDLLKSGSGFDFSGQPHFVLGAVGPTDERQLAELLEDVVSRHRLRMQEIKSAKLATRPAFVRDLVAALRERKIPLFVEAVDKVFYLAVGIVNCHVMPPSAGEPGEGDQYLRNVFADFLYHSLPDAVLATFVDACLTDTPQAVRASLERLLTWARGGTAHTDEERMILGAVVGSVELSIDEFERIVADDPRGHRRFLPLPDQGKGGTTYWVLPNYSSLTNLYARINRYQRGRLAQLTLVHDEQPQYDEVLRQAKAAVETFVDNSGHDLPAADYSFGETATLRFANSAESPGLMVADVIAGHVRRVLRDHIAGRSIGNAAFDAFVSVWDAQDGERGPGLNLVIPTATVQSLQMLALMRRRELAESA